MQSVFSTCLQWRSLTVLDTKVAPFFKIRWEAVYRCLRVFPCSFCTHTLIAAYMLFLALFTHTHTHTHTQTHPPTQPPTRTHACTHAHTHTHTYLPGNSSTLPATGCTLQHLLAKDLPGSEHVSLPPCKSSSSSFCTALPGVVVNVADDELPCKIWPAPILGHCSKTTVGPPSHPVAACAAASLAAAPAASASASAALPPLAASLSCTPAASPSPTAA